MSLSTTLWAHLQAALLLLLPLCLLPETLRHQPALRIGAPLLLLAAAFLPVGEPDPSDYLYAYTGGLSLPTLALVAALIGRRLWSLEMLPQQDRRAILTGAATAGVLLYPMTLGLGPFDPYAMGFAGPLLPLLLSAAAAAAWWWGLRATAVVLLAVLGSWLLALGESQNLWDYLLDAWLWLYAVARLAARILAKT